MRANDICERLRRLFRDVKPQAPHERLGPDDDILDTLNLDSLDVANAIVEIEALFAVALDMEEFVRLNTLTKLADSLETKGHLV